MTFVDRNGKPKDFGCASYAFTSRDCYWCGRSTFPMPIAYNEYQFCCMEHFFFFKEKVLDKKSDNKTDKGK